MNSYLCRQRGVPCYLRCAPVIYIGGMGGLPVSLLRAEMTKFAFKITSVPSDVEVQHVTKNGRFVLTSEHWAWYYHSRLLIDSTLFNQ
jgi:hypothetical protein